MRSGLHGHPWKSDFRMLSQTMVHNAERWSLQLYGRASRDPDGSLPGVLANRRGREPESFLESPALHEAYALHGGAVEEYHSPRRE